MAGHSKFANIKHRKGAQDKKRGKVFNRCSKEIMIAARSGSDPNMNPRLRGAIVTAKKLNMPNDRIDTAIKKGSGELEGGQLEEIRYEGYGAGGIAIIVETATDNKNRTAAEVRSTFTKQNGNMGESGSVGFMFDRKGVITYLPEAGDADTMFETALEAGAENCESDDDGHEITCAIEDFSTVRDGLVEKFGDAEESSLRWVPQTLTVLDADASESAMKLIEALDDLDDVQEVATNADFDEGTLEAMAS
ncbi:MAG: YebC/PmpR family DNA-binding transcriptional regulator [Rickettsiales bacterium]|nr:YebC/PmpR family DNA-binding transcriptional regulator [Rickettsiales bacterium]